MSKIHFLLTKQSIHITMDGQYIRLSEGDKNFGEIRELIKKGELEAIPEVFARKLVTITQYIENSGLVLVDGRLQDLEGNQLPEVLSARLQELRDEGFDVTNLIRFWDNLKLNPSMNSREQLYRFLEQHGHPLTDDGHFIAYRGVTNDLKDRWTRTFDNSPGSICEMPRRDVDDDPNKTCSNGLHVAAHDYAESFSDVTVEVKVNPRDVVAVPNDYNGKKMRVCRFEVLRICNEKNTQTVYGYENGPVKAVVDNKTVYPNEIVEFVLGMANDFKDRYADRAVLATRIEEEIDKITVADVLAILNENEGGW